MIELDLREDPVRDAPAVRDWARGSRWVAAVVTLCLLVALAGSVPIQRRLTRAAVVAVPPGTSITLTDRRLYTISGTTGGAAPTVSAYTLTGQRLWHAASRFTDNVLFQEAGDLLLVTGVNRSGEAETLGVDAVTGAQRWSLPEQIDVLPGGRTGLIATADFQAAAPPGAAGAVDASGTAFFPGPSSTTMRGVDLADGHDLWSRTFPGSARHGRLPGSAEVVVADSAGVQVLDARTGEIRRSAELTGGFTLEGFSVTDDLIIAQQAGRRGGMTIAFRSDTLAEVWRIRLPGNAAISGCQDLPCLLQSVNLSVLDPATGKEAYQVDAAGVLRLGGHTLLVPSAGATDLRVVTSADGTTRSLPGWSLVMPSFTVADRAAAPALVTRTHDDRVWLGALTGSGGDPEELGSLARSVLDCQSTVTMVACRTAVEEIQIWQLQGVRS